ncbi:oxygen-independent coproporphyrinogen III oxidase [Phenylobacterium sp.]|uniref:oxygen-independent coproporphyrinogen III oxidase n=1 Tax=Phenylobacterium sp. TaxID=1871053 RepID=UPI0028A2A8B0|nr:oxygen-independent coproporphyrinogen III oxidase [Phenylobacterium sp.]
MTAHALQDPQALADLIARYDGRAPRYTSYPTAVQFTPQVGEAAYRRWLAELPAHEPVSLYMHVPFCARLCWYCGCNTRAVNRHEPVAAYVGKLLDEIRLLGQALPSRPPANALHFGGGTPNMLSPAELDVLFAALGQVFDLSADIEVATEIDPPALTREWVRAAAAHGLRRASLGVQNLSPEVQAAVDRKGTIEEAARCVGWLREAGVASINLDLMYGLPHQTTANTLATIDAVLSLRPERLALFGYAHVPWMKSHQQLIAEEALPGPAERLDQSERAAERLVAEGYVRIGLDHFALPDDELAVALAEGRLRRNFQGYTTDAARTLIGMGASAIGGFPQGYVQNLTRELDWRAALERGELPVARGVTLTEEDRFRGEIIERLMCDFAVDLRVACARHDRSLADLALILARLEPFRREGLIEAEGGQVRVVGAGRLVIRSICAAIDEYFDAQQGRHAKAL